MPNKVDKLPWETEEQVKYRRLLVRASTKITKGMNRIEKAYRRSIRSKKPADYLEAASIFQSLAKEIEKASPPQAYAEVHTLLTQGVESYNRAVEHLIEAAKSRNVQTNDKAVRYFQEGSSFIRIARSRSWNIVETGQKEHKQAEKQASGQ